MSDIKMIAPALPNIPWQEKPAGEEFNHAPVWRYTENPIINRYPTKEVARIFNSAVMPYNGEFIGVFRGEQTNGVSMIYLGHSKDAIHWNFQEEKIHFVDEEGKDFQPIYAYDPRLVKIAITSCGARTCMAQPSALQRQRISRPLPDWKIPSFLSTEMLFFSPERSTETT